MTQEKGMQLSPMEMRVIQVHRQLTDEIREMYLGAMERTAERQAAERAARRPALRVIQGGAQ